MKVNWQTFDITGGEVKFNNMGRNTIEMFGMSDEEIHFLKDLYDIGGNSKDFFQAVLLNNDIRTLARFAYAGVVQYIEFMNFAGKSNTPPSNDETIGKYIERMRKDAYEKESGIPSGNGPRNQNETDKATK